MTINNPQVKRRDLLKAGVAAIRSDDGWHPSERSR